MNFLIHFIVALDPPDCSCRCRPQELPDRCPEQPSSLSALLLGLQQSQQIAGATSEVGVAAQPAHLVSFSGFEPPDLPQSYLVASRQPIAQTSSSRATSGCASLAINSLDLRAAFTGFDSSADLHGLLGSTSHFLTACAGIAHPYLQFLRAHQADRRLLIYRLGAALEEPGAASPAQVHL